MQMNVRFLGPTSVRMGSVQISFLRILATVAPASSTITSGLSVWVRKSFFLLPIMYGVCINVWSHSWSALYYHANVLKCNDFGDV